MVFIRYFIRILPQEGFNIPGNCQISTKMHGISFAAVATPQTPLWAACIAPRPLRYQREKGRGGEGEEKGGKGKGKGRGCRQSL